MAGVIGQQYDEVRSAAEVERERLRPLPATAMPHWVKMRRLRASETR